MSRLCSVIKLVKDAQTTVGRGWSPHLILIQYSFGGKFGAMTAVRSSTALGDISFRSLVPMKRTTLIPSLGLQVAGLLEMKLSSPKMYSLSFNF